MLYVGRESLRIIDDLVELYVFAADIWGIKTVQECEIDSFELVAGVTPRVLNNLNHFGVLDNR